MSDFGTSLQIHVPRRTADIMNALPVWLLLTSLLILLPASVFAQMNWTRATQNAGWTARVGQSAAVYDGKIWVLGGDDGTRHCDVWFSANGSSWTEATANANWSARCMHSSVVFNDKLWVLGGFDGSPKNDVWWSTGGATWTRATDHAGWSARTGHSSVVFDGKMWVIGGTDAGGPRSDVWFSSDGIAWSQATANAGWSARHGHTSVAQDGRMWVIGGFDGTGRRNDVWYSTGGVVWSQATARAEWSARSYHTSVVLGGNIWVLGGDDDDYRNDVWRSTTGATWTLAAASAGWSPRCYHSSSVCDSQRIWVLAGSDGANRNDVWYSALLLPPAPAPTQPADGDTVSTLRPALGVQPVPSAIQYRFRVYHDGSLVLEGCTSSATWTVGQDLANGATHDWECQVQNGAGLWGPCFSPRWSFTVAVLPSPPSPIAPANGEIVTTFRPTLRVGQIPGCDQYHFRGWRGDSLVRDGYSVTGSWRVDSALRFGMTYDWDCRAHNSAGWSSFFSPRWSFSVYPVPSLATSQYPMFRRNLLHTGASSYAGSQLPEVRWFYYTTEPVFSSPVVAPDATIYFVSENDSLYGLAATGARKWTRFLGTDAGTQCTPAVAADSTVYIGNGHGILLALPYDLAAPLWSYQTGDSILSSPAICGAIYFGSNDGYLYALNEDGSLKWRNYIGAAIRSSPAVAPDSTIYVGSDNQYLYAVNPDGTTRWNIWLQDVIRSSPLIGPDGTVYVGTDGARLWAISAQGLVKWFFATGNKISSSPAMDAGGRIYFGSDDHYVYAVEDEGASARQIWRYPTGNSVSSSPSVSSDGTVYVGSDDYYVYALRCTDGALVWRVLTGNLIRSSPAIGKSGMIYVGSNDDRLYAIGPPIGIEENNGRVNPVSEYVSLYSAYPSLFISQAAFKFHLRHSTRVNLQIRALDGKLVRTLASGTRERGEHTITWDGQTQAGTPAPSGVYFCLLEAGGGQHTIRMLKLE